MRQNMLASGIEFQPVSVDSKDGALCAQRYRIMSLPSLLIMRNGEPYRVVTGVLTPGQIVEAVG